MKITARTQPQALTEQLNLLYAGKKTDFHADFAKLMIFLSTPELFQRHYLEISEDLREQYTYYKRLQFQLLTSDSDLTKKLKERGFDFDPLAVISTAAFDGVAVVWGGTL